VRNVPPPGAADDGGQNALVAHGRVGRPRVRSRRLSFVPLTPEEALRRALLTPWPPASRPRPRPPTAAPT
jgi:hypothetical protein